ncbi:MAG: glycosyltransferase family 4 protein [Planctomycetota bacterium]
MNRRLDDQVKPVNVLLIAYGCEPGRGSEPGIGWNHLVETARARPAFVITHPRHRDALEAGIADWNRSGQGFPIRAIYVDDDGPLKRLGEAGYMGFNLHYFRWGNAAMKAAERLHDEVGIGLVQHVSLTRWWMPTPGYVLAKKGVPLIWGPMGAGECMPWSMRRGIGVRGHVTEWSRAAARRIFGLDPRLKRCGRLTTLGLCEPRETVGRLESIGVKRVERAATLPADLDQMTDVEPMPKPPGTFRVVSGGGLVYWKCFDLSLRAFAESIGHKPNVEYVHASGGQMMDKMRAIGDAAGLGEKLKLPGNMPHAQTLRWVKSADVLVLPTLRDTTGHVYEALACGIPVLTVDRLSCGAVVDETSGHRVPLEGGREGLTNGMAATLRKWYDDPELRKRLGEGARKRADLYSLHAFGDRVRECQQTALDLHAKQTVTAN